MTTVRVTFTPDPKAYFEGYRKTIAGADAVLFTTAVEVYGETTPAALERLGVPAPPVEYPLEWTSPAQRKAVMRKLRRAGTLPYRRTGAYEQGWTISLVRDPGAVRFILTNPTAWAVWVGGSLDRNNFARAQQRMHARTGWALSQPLVTLWAETVVSAVTARFMERMRQRVAQAQRGG